jgi:hypothetical protein
MINSPTNQRPRLALKYGLRSLLMKDLRQMQFEEQQLTHCLNTFTCYYV